MVEKSKSCAVVTHVKPDEAVGVARRLDRVVAESGGRAVVAVDNDWPAVFQTGGQVVAVVKARCRALADHITQTTEHVDVLHDESLARLVRQHIVRYKEDGRDRVRPGYDMPKVVFALLQLSKGAPSPIFRVDADAVPSPDGISAVKRHFGFASDHVRVASGRYAITSKDNTRDLVNGTSVRVGQMFDACDAVRLLSADNEPGPVQIDCDAAEEFLGLLGTIAVDPFTQVISGALLSAEDGIWALPPFCGFRQLAMWVDDALLVETRRACGINVESVCLTDVVVQQDRHNGRPMTVSDARWHCNDYIRRLLSGVAMAGVVRCEAFADALASRYADGQQRQEIWETCLRQASEFCKIAMRFPDTGLGTLAVGPISPYYAELAGHGFFSWVPGLCGAVAELPVDFRKVTRGHSPLGDQLTTLVEDLVEYVSAENRSWWDSLVETARSFEYAELVSARETGTARKLPAA